MQIIRKRLNLDAQGMRFAAVVVMLGAVQLAGCQSAKPFRECRAIGRSVRSIADPVIGNWSAKLPYDRMTAGSFIFARTEDGVATAFVLWRFGAPNWCKDVKVNGNEFSFHFPYGQRVRGKVCGDRMFAEAAPCDENARETGPYVPFEGWRNVPVCPYVSTEDAKFGTPIDLLKDGLHGWQCMDDTARFGWSYKDGVLSNRIGTNPDGTWKGGGANLKTKKSDFGDFNLEYDVRVPRNSNSGVYLRGRFECQVVDSYGKPLDRFCMASYYGRATPIVSAEKAPGEWQHVSVTLYKRHLTVVLNGVTVIENAEVNGVTGGAIDADINAPGPIYLQGDHSDADYKNMILREALQI